jgi:hypothetical protein
LEAVRGQFPILCTPEGHIDPQGFDQEVILQKLHESVDHIAAASRWIGLLLNATEYE